MFGQASGDRGCLSEVVLAFSANLQAASGQLPYKQPKNDFKANRFQTSLYLLQTS